MFNFAKWIRFYRYAAASLSAGPHPGSIPLGAPHHYNPALTGLYSPAVVAHHLAERLGIPPPPQGPPHGKLKNNLHSKFDPKDSHTLIL